MDVNCAWRYKAIVEVSVEKSSLVIKTASALGVSVTQLKDIRACDDDGMLVGMLVGLLDGLLVGLLDGMLVGLFDGTLVGSPVGSPRD